MNAQRSASAPAPISPNAATPSSGHVPSEPGSTPKTQMETAAGRSDSTLRARSIQVTRTCSRRHS
ncbi:hypothetical protein [Actinomadura sp. WMMB 499]|uniref:hypothetical protein n=1 Tax=Actinomadura sp. WMMB 499 TaxID=1219491 RepID=UPI0020C7E506|nr:hypothetical protein [Actinomadura sp. WMMB 499]